MFVPVVGEQGFVVDEPGRSVLAPEGGGDARQRGGDAVEGRIAIDGEGIENGERAPFTVKKGDEVIFTSYAGTELKLDGGISAM